MCYLQDCWIVNYWIPRWEFLKICDWQVEDGRCLPYIDRHYGDSIKVPTRFNRETGASRVYHLTLDTPIQSKDVILKVSENKEQLIQLIFNDLVANAMLIFPRKLNVTGKRSCSATDFQWTYILLWKLTNNSRRSWQYHNSLRTSVIFV